MDWLSIGSATDTGKIKAENQDYHAAYPPAHGKRSKLGTLIALADGMGGHRGGSTASKLAVDVLFESYYKSTSSGIPDALANGFQAANQAVYDRSTSEPSLSGMGCTLTAVVVKGKTMHFGHVGDSRGYHISENRISQFTDDHSLVASMVKAGVITPEEAPDHPDRHVITRAIGLKEEIEPDIGTGFRLHKGDLMLLCCDGLWEVVSDTEMLKTAQTVLDPSRLCQALVDQANDNGGPDNITAVAARLNKTGLLGGFL
jgi:protein phosphatase